MSTRGRQARAAAALTTELPLAGLPAPTNPAAAAAVAARGLWLSATLLSFSVRPAPSAIAFRARTARNLSPASCGPRGNPTVFSSEQRSVRAASRCFSPFLREGMLTFTITGF